MLSNENEIPKHHYVPSSEFKSMSLNKFCVKRHFEIGLVNSLTVEDEPFLNDLISLSKIKEDVTQVTFIESNEVTKFIEASSSPKELIFPPFLLQELKDFSECYDDFYSGKLGLLGEACSIKFKLIQKMYEQFSNEVNERKRLELVSKELAALAEKRPIGSRDKRNKGGSRSKLSTGTKNKKSVATIDCTELGITENDLVVNDILKDQVYFYILRGYNDINLVKELLHMHVKISFIIQVSQYENREKTSTNQFWADINNVRANSCDFLQNTALMKYQSPSHYNCTDYVENYLKDMLDVVKSLIDLKRMHFDYVKDLLLIETKFTETFTAFPVYKTRMDQYPLETLSIPLIIDSILEEVHIKSNKNSTNAGVHIPYTRRKKTSCPFDQLPKIKPFKQTKTEKEPPYFKVYEKDNLNLIFNSYKVGSQYMKNTLRVLKLQLPVQTAEWCEFNETIDDFMPHSHEIGVPGKNRFSLTNEQADHLINLLYLKNSILQKSTQNVIDGNEFTRNLIIHESKKYVEDSMPKFVNAKSGKFSETFIGIQRQYNVYESIKPLTLHWAEILKPELLLQHLLDGQLRYLSSDYIVCELTNSLMIRFHNDVDPCGLHTTVWKEFLRTPVGLADFCKYVLIDDYEWIRKHIPYSQITYVDVVRMLEALTPIRLAKDISYSAYKHLLTPEIQYSSSDIRIYNNCSCLDDIAFETTSSNNTRGLSDQEELTGNLQDILRDLDEYNKTVDFSEQCKRDQHQSYSFPAYGLGQNKFNITGHTTTFISLDNVSITIDSSRLCTEKSHLMLKLSSDDNLLILHTNQKNFNFHFVLSDGTIVFFAKPIKEENPPKLNTSVSLSQINQNLTNDFQGKCTLSELSHPSEVSRQEDEEHMIVTMDFNRYRSLDLYPIVGNIIREAPEEVYKRDAEKEMDILQRLQHKPNCIKVSRRDSFQHLDQILTENTVPISNVVRRIINNPEKNRGCNMPRRKCLILGDVPPRKPNAFYDYAVTVPNGLTVKVMVSDYQNNSYVVKQSYEYSEGPGFVSEEKYRLFTNDGNVIIRRIDGTMKILTSSGKEVRFDKILNTSSDELSCRSHKKLDEALVRKLLTRLMSNYPDQEGSEFYPSRRGHLHSKSKSVSNCPKLVEISNIPFSSISMITLNGDKITLKDKKLSKMLYSRLMSEINFLTEERILKREDGFSSITDRDGSHYVEFADGTSIKTTVYVEEELVRVNAKDKMGWVVITTVFCYQHPFYKPVSFDNIKNSIQIRINEYQTLDVVTGGARLGTKNSTYDIKTDSIIFHKTCELCDSQFNCEISIEPLYQNKKPDEDANFVIAKDSYDKTFKTDFFGNCKVIPSTIKGNLNKYGCDHASLTDHQKIYCMKKDLSGMLLWGDTKLTSMVKDTEENKQIQYNTDSKNALLLITITKNVSTKFSDRFSGKIIKQFEKLTEILPNNRPVLYQVTRKLYNLIDVEQLDELIKCLMNIFKGEDEEELKESKSTLELLHKYANLSHSSISTISEEEIKIPQMKVSVHEKIMAMNRKRVQAKKLMRCPLPNYFNSTLCTYVPP